MKDIVLEAIGVHESEGRLTGIDMTVADSEFVAVLANDPEARQALLKVLGFLKAPPKGEVRFQGRVVGRQGPDELSRMRDKVVSLRVSDLDKDPGPGVAVVLADDDGGTGGASGANAEEVVAWVNRLNEGGVAVVLATSDPALAVWAQTVYKISGGRLQRICCP